MDKGLVTNQLVLTVGYDIENLTDPQWSRSYCGLVSSDRYGRKIPKHAVGTENFPCTSSANDLQRAAELYGRIVNHNLLIRCLSSSTNSLLDEAAHAREWKLQEAMLGIKKRYGKDAIPKG